MKNTSRSAFLCKVAAWLSRIFAIWNKQRQTSSYHIDNTDYLYLKNNCNLSLCISHPLAGELAEDGGDVARVLSHDFTDIFLHTRWNATGHTRHDLLELQQRQRGVP